MMGQTAKYVLAVDNLGANRLTWYQLERLLDALRKNKSVTIECQGEFGPFLSDLIAEMTVIKEAKS
jgi:hypothetical protein